MPNDEQEHMSSQKSRSGASNLTVFFTGPTGPVPSPASPTNGWKAVPCADQEPPASPRLRDRYETQPHGGLELTKLTRYRNLGVGRRRSLSRSRSDWC